jgi:hypothetical protein
MPFAYNKGRLAIKKYLAGRHTIPMQAFRTWNNRGVTLPATPANDDLGIVTGTHGTDAPNLQTGDLKAAGATTRYAGVEVMVPDKYRSGTTLTLRAHAGMKTTISDGTASIDFTVYEVDREAGESGDICATAAQSINSVTLADKDFVITPTGLVSGDLLDIVCAIAVADAATGTAVIGQLGALELIFDE